MSPTESVGLPTLQCVHLEVCKSLPGLSCELGGCKGISEVRECLCVFVAWLGCLLCVSLPVDVWASSEPGIKGL